MLSIRQHKESTLTKTVKDYKAIRSTTMALPDIVHLEYIKHCLRAYNEADVAFERSVKQLRGAQSNEDRKIFKEDLEHRHRHRDEAEITLKEAHRIYQEARRKAIAVPSTPNKQHLRALSLEEVSAQIDHNSDMSQNPWSRSPRRLQPDRENQLRKQVAKYYKRYKVKSKKGKQVTHSKCCVTDVWGDSNTVVAALLLPLGTTSSNIQKELNMQGKLTDVRNIIPLLKTIEDAYNTQRLCFVLDNKDPTRHKLQILDPTLKNEFVHGNVTFEELSQCSSFELPQGEDGLRPFTKCLSFHAQSSYDRAVKKKWISSRSEPRPVEYGSPLTTDESCFPLRTASTEDTTAEADRSDEVSLGDQSI